MKAKKFVFLFSIIILLLLGFYPRINAQPQDNFLGHQNLISQSSINHQNPVIQNNKNDNSVVIIQQLHQANIPYTITEDILNSQDFKKAYSQEQFELLSLHRLQPTGNQYQYFPIARFKLSNNFYSLLILQYYREESLAWLINYSLTGEYIDSLQVFYSNSEGFMWVNATIQENNIIIEQGNIYENNGTNIIKFVNFDTKGNFLN